MCHWNCKKLAEALAMAIPLTDSERELERIYWPEYNKHYNQKMRNKVHQNHTLRAVSNVKQRSSQY
jgi:hypothetical protein